MKLNYTLTCLFLVVALSINAQNSTTNNNWPKPFKVIDIESSLDGEIQKAYFYVSNQKKPQPLIISLHTWSDNYTQKDLLIEQIIKNDWNYIHPDFRGENNTPKACGSKFAISDIDDAITYAIAHSNVDMDNIHVIGKSGGGMATLLAYMNSKHPVTSFSSWVPISDLQAWYYQSLGRKNKYALDILAATSNNQSELNVDEARLRSALFMATPKDLRNNSRLAIYVGIHDGYTGSVPVSQSINFYNKIISDYGASSNELISSKEIIDLVSMRTFPVQTDKKIADRAIIFERSYKNTSIILFEGTHEMLEPVAFDLVQVE